MSLEPPRSGADPRRPPELTELGLHAVVSSAPIVLFAVDRRGIFTLSEGRSLAALGLEPGQVLGQSAFDLYRDNPGVVASLTRALAGEEFSAVAEVGDLTFDVRYTPMRDPAGGVRGAVGVAIDVSEQRRLEGQLREAQKLEAVGRLAAGVAHDFGNLLTVILGNAELMLRRLPADHPVQHCAGEIQRASMQAALFTRQLVSYSRRDVGAPQRLELGAAVTGMETLLRRAVGEEARLVLVPGREPMWVLADRALLEQALMNLVIAARDALGRGGHVVVEVGDREVPADEAHGTLEPGTWVALSVRHGGAEGSRARGAPCVPGAITGESAGLGLSLAGDIARRSGGRLLPGEGASAANTMVLYLPRVPSDALDQAA